MITCIYPGRNLMNNGCKAALSVPLLWSEKAVIAQYSIYQHTVRLGLSTLCMHLSLSNASLLACW
jgi:hypothetical protein